MLRNRKALAGMISVVAFALVSEAAMAQRSGPPNPIPDRYIVVVNRGVSSAAVLSDHGLVARFIYSASVNGFAAVVPPGRLTLLQADSRVAMVIPDREVSAFQQVLGNNGQGKGNKGGGSGQVIPAGIERVRATQVWPANITGAGVGVAVLDTGLDLSNSDLTVGNQSFSAFGGTAQDDEGHGTHVGGIIAARNNEADVVGVAPDAVLYAVKVLDRFGNGSDSDVMAGLEWVARWAGAVYPPIRIVNMSLGRSGSIGDNPGLREAVQTLYNKGLTVVAAAGNDCASTVSQMVPATYPEVMAIASTTAAAGSNQCRRLNGAIQTDTASYFTTDGKFDTSTGIGVTISAPGEDQEDVSKSCFISSVGILSLKVGGGTTRMSGTSMAAPHAAGVVALMLSKNPGVSPGTARNIIRGTADGLNAVPLNNPGSCYTYDGEREGVINALQAVAAVPWP